MYLPMFGVNCFVVQVLHRRRKRGGGVSAYVWCPLFCCSGAS